MKRIIITAVVMILLVTFVYQAFAIQTLLPEGNSYDEMRMNTRNILNSTLLLIVMGLSFIAGAAVMAFIWEIVEEQRKHRLHH
ncbi:hypothetical protein [Solitalea canadensis]|uniref:Uncharacterized protein n=1 Tax=Solitalea canadensis (strain ATCC 29591 / DSM 3403 / JCM 21819 / LMG 8368 / NBRC 15130 / NCIMB 12057 / USAM 9D) TaxID=929556 RepID=H8KKX6_SOLCM|nr:hypothetical protein [Solitalea canadensis]AFD08793.1 hypothetical protein Solca_3793 [Solitalea canadensis DSM 3403]